MEGEEVVTEFERRTASAIAHKRGLAEDLAAMYGLLPDMRRAGKGPKEIEAMSEGLIPRDTASRRTASVIGTSRPKKATEPASA